MCKSILIAALVLVSFNVLGAPPSDYVQAYIVGKDTIYSYTLDEVEVATNRVFKTKKEEREYRRYVAQYTRLMYNIKRAYPFAVATREQLAILNTHYLELKTNKARKEYTKTVEAGLRARFEADLKKLSMRQGLILLKLIDRETDNNAFELIKEFRGGFTATFFQTFARLFGMNLKQEYDPFGEDKMMEEIVEQIEQGLI